MSQRLFSVPKIGLFLDSYVPAMEKRKGGEVKILTLTLRCQPFDSKLATAIDDGVGDDSGVRVALFKLNHPDPKPHLTRVNFSLSCPRQNLIIYASPDTHESRVGLDQVKISGLYARTQKDINGFALVFKASYGPVGRTEQEYIHEWMLSQRFVTFQESEPSMEFEDDGSGDDDELTDADEKARQTAQPAPMWNDDAPAAPAGETDKPKSKKDRANRPLHSHQSKKGKKR